MTSLAKLRVLEAQDNKLSEFPDNARRMLALEVLSLRESEKEIVRQI